MTFTFLFLPPFITSWTGSFMFCLLLLIQPVGTGYHREHCSITTNPGTDSFDHCNYLDHKFHFRVASSCVFFFHFCYIFVVLLLFLLLVITLSNLASGDCRTSRLKLTSVHLRKVYPWTFRQFMDKQFYSQNLDLAVQVTCLT